MDLAATLEWFYGPTARTRFQFYYGVKCQRRGQAFMNVLRDCDVASYNRITNSLYDPFYLDINLPGAIDLLTSK